MIPEQQRIEISKASGWSELKTGGWRRPDGSIENQHYGESWRLPDYLNDLNAMHSAETVIFNQQQWLEYADWIISIQPKDQSPLRATASQRAEAFLRTIGKWVES